MNEKHFEPLLLPQFQTYLKFIPLLFLIIFPYPAFLLYAV